MYILSHYKGIEKSTFIKATSVYEINQDDILSLLEKHQVILVDENGLLHLNSKGFFEMTIWDLLLLTEPWVAKRSDREDKRMRIDEVEEMAKSKKLFEQYMSYHGQPESCE